MINCQKCQTEITKDDELKANYREIKEGPNYGQYNHINCPDGKDQSLEEMNKDFHISTETTEADTSSWIVK